MAEHHVGRGSGRGGETDIVPQQDPAVFCRQDEDFISPGRPVFLNAVPVQINHPPDCVKGLAWRLPYDFSPPRSANNTSSIRKEKVATPVRVACDKNLVLTAAKRILPVHCGANDGAGIETPSRQLVVTAIRMPFCWRNSVHETPMLSVFMGNHQKRTS